MHPDEKAIMSRTIWVGAVAYDPKVVTIWEGMRRYFHEHEGLVEGQQYRTLRFNSDIGKHGDTGTSEAEVVRAVLDGRADAGAIGSPYWSALRSQRLVPEGALIEIWTSPPYNHCMFTARPDLDPLLAQRFA